MKIDWKKVAAFFGIPEATEAEVDARLDEELASRKDAEKAPEARDKGEDAGAAEVKKQWPKPLLRKPTQLPTPPPSPLLM
jgi:hypothetical protein